MQKKKFNITGVCYPELHYMMDNSYKLEKTLELIEGGEYFTINRPRQYGKTTILHALGKHLEASEAYLPIPLNFQGIDSKWHQSDAAFAQMFVEEVIRALRYTQPDLTNFLIEKQGDIRDMNALSGLITELMFQANKKVVLLIDEVDASSNYEPFLSFLGMLRTKYLARLQPQHATFFSIVLAGVHDIKSLKYKLKDPSETQYNSPWNIAVDFDIDLSYNPKEIAPMLEQYSQAEGVQMDIPKIAERLYYYTSGYPFLVSKLCKIIAESILPQNKAKQWTLADVEAAIQLLLKENNTNFDSVIKNLENHQDLYDLVFKLVIDGANVAFNQYNPTIFKGMLYGIFKRNGRVRIHNLIYEQLIYDYMISNLEITLDTESYNFENQFLTQEKALDIPKILLKFQQFIREQYSDKDQQFLEREWRLIFLAFLQPILNGKGYTFKEVQVSQEKRLDVVVTYQEHRYIIELKRWYGKEYHEQGLAQLVDYLDIHNAQKGYLLIFDQRKEKSWSRETVQIEGKEILAVWV